MSFYTVTLGPTLGPDTVTPHFSSFEICRYHAAFSPDGSLLCVLYEEAATLWDAEQNALLRVLSVPSPSLRNSPLRRVVFGGGRKREESVYVYVYVRCALCVVCVCEGKRGILFCTAQ